MPKLTPQRARRIIAQLEVLEDKEAEHGLKDLVTGWKRELEPNEKVLVNRYHADKAQLEFQFEERYAVFGPQIRRELPFYKQEKPGASGLSAPVVPGLTAHDC